MALHVSLRPTMASDLDAVVAIERDQHRILVRMRSV